MCTLNNAQMHFPVLCEKVSTSETSNICFKFHPPPHPQFVCHGPCGHALLHAHTHTHNGGKILSYLKEQTRLLASDVPKSVEM